MQVIAPWDIDRGAAPAPRLQRARPHPIDGGVAQRRLPLIVGRGLAGGDLGLGDHRPGLAMSVLHRASSTRFGAGARAWTHRSRPTLAAGLAALVLAPMPVVLPPYPLIELCYVLTLGIAGLGVNLLFGTTGLLSLGHAAYFGLGAYAGALLFNLFGVQSLEVYLLAGVVTATVMAALSGAWCVHATRIHFTIMTLAFGQLVHAVFVVGVPFRLLGDLGEGLYFVGHGGLYIPRLTILGAELPPERFFTVFYYVLLVAFFATLGVLWRVTRSPFGMALRAIRDNDVRAAFVGNPVRAYRWRAFVLSGAVLGLAGGLTGSSIARSRPSSSTGSSPGQARRRHDNRGHPVVPRASRGRGRVRGPPAHREPVRPVPRPGAR